MKDQIYAPLDEGQRRAVTAPRGPVCVLAGAGTGKTRTITHRIAHLIASGEHRADEILAVTFTTRAAGEMRTRLRSLGAAGVQARTFHSAALKQLAFFWPRVIGGDMWPVLEHKMRLVAAAARRAQLSTDTAVLRDLASEIEWAKACLISPEDFAEAVGRIGRQSAIDPRSVTAAYSGYEQAKTAARVLDFDDLLLQICAILENDDDTARTFRSRYRSFIVDEYQDVTPLQQRVLDAWLGGRDDVTVVGDANQTIYSFAGASPRYLLDFAKRYPQATVVKLERDYRSTPQVVSLANRVIAPARGAASALRLTLTAVLADGPEVAYHEAPDETAEADEVARRIGALIAKGTAPSEIAVLYRINAQSEVYEQALSRAGIPYTVRGGEQFFARTEVRQAIVALRAASKGEYDGTLAESVRAALEPLGLSAVPPPPGAVRDRWDSLSALVAIAEELAGVDPSADLARLVTELDTRAQSRHDPAPSGVTLASFHAAKGLEWDAVFLVGLTDGTLPIQYAESDEAIEEERRLLYVGVTRARTVLTLSWALARNPGGRSSRRRSRFLDSVVPQANRPAPRLRSRAGRCLGCGGLLIAPHEKKLRRCSSCPSNADPELIAALKSWRKEKAAAASVPAYVVFTDLTLLAIAERRPTNPAALRAISGIGPAKLDKYGSELLDLLGGFGEG